MSGEVEEEILARASATAAANQSSVMPFSNDPSPGTSPHAAVVSELREATSRVKNGWST